MVKFSAIGCVELGLKFAALRMWEYQVTEQCLGVVVAIEALAAILLALIWYS